MEGLDKLKRRVIRSVARMVVREKKPEEEVWTQLSKETGCDCKAVWKLMKTVTLKKMNRLLLAEDRLVNVATAAQMTLTDWLMFDLVLVHDDIDVIGMGLKNKKSDKLPQLIDLFMKVQKYDVEGKHGEALANAWTAATFAYNSEGRQCSPMLLQRRWFLMKKSTRQAFYNFWFSYRGNPRLLENAVLPNRLQKAIAQRYPHIITKPFMEWSECIEKKFVILPEEFETRIRVANMNEDDPGNEAPDVVVVAQNIETIEIGDDDDSDPEKGSTSDNINTTAPSHRTNSKDPPDIGVQIKIEPADDDVEAQSPFLTLDEQLKIRSQRLLDNIDNIAQEIDKIDNPVDNIKSADIEASTNSDAHSASKSNSSATNKEYQNTIRSVDKEANKINEDNTKTFNNAVTQRNKSTSDTESIIDLDYSTPESESLNEPPAVGVEGEMMMPQITNVFGNVNVGCDVLVKISNMSMKARKHSILNVTPSHVVKDTIVLDPDEPIDIDEVIKNKLDKNLNKVQKNSVTKTTKVAQTIEKKNRTREINSGSNINVTETIDLDPDEPIDSDATIKEKAETYIMNAKKIEKENYTPFTKDEKTPKMETGSDKPKENTENASLTNPFLGIPADLTFVDDGIVLEDDGIEFIDNDDEDNVDSPGTVKIKDEVKVEDEDEDNLEFDIKLLLQPVAYTTRLDEMKVFHNKPVEYVNDRELLEKAVLESKPKIEKVADCVNIKVESSDKMDVCLKADDNSERAESPTPVEEEISEENKIKLNSSLLQKPRTRSYNPIQLCKNPDFNTRLKRLTVGFLSSTRNRSMLKTLKPMTVDVSKGFESKLVNGTLYLKSCDSSTSVIKAEKDIEQKSRVLPSAIAVQSLIDNIKVAIKDILPPPSDEVVQTDKPSENTIIFMERKKVINLPDIDQVRQMNQRLFTAEITPMKIQDKQKCQPPVHLVSMEQKQNANSSKLPEQIQSNSNPEQENAAQTVESGDAEQDRNADAMNVIKSVNKKPKYHYISNCRAKPVAGSWINKHFTVKKDCAPSDTLLTCNTLNKMLYLLTKKQMPLCVSENRDMLKRDKKFITNQIKELENRVALYESLAADVNTGSEEAQPQVSNTVVESSTKSEDKPLPKPKLKVIHACCWARLKIKGHSKGKKHKCPRICRCCCRDELVIKTKRTPRPIDISDNEKDLMNRNVRGLVKPIIKETKEIIMTPTKPTESDKIKAQILPPNVPMESYIDMDNNFNLKTVIEQNMNNAAPTEPAYIEQAGVITIDASLNKTTEGPVPSMNISIQNMKPQIKIKEIPALLPLPKTNNKTKQKVTSENSFTYPILVPSEINEKEKILYLKIKDRFRTRPGCPIFLGKNKILLTDGKMPPHLAGTPIDSAIVPQPTPPIDIMSPLPAGVHIVLLPNGNLTYTIDPNSQISDKQLAAIPTILNAVQEKLSSSAEVVATNPPIAPVATIDISNQADPVINLIKPNTENSLTEPIDSLPEETSKIEKDEETIEKDNEMKEKGKQPNIVTSNDDQNKNLDVTKSNMDQIAVSQVENTLPSNIVNWEEIKVIPNKQTDNTDNSNNGDSDSARIEKTLSSDPLNPSICADSSEANAQNTSCAPDTKRKTILSDLMEMSGISAEDTAPVVEAPCLTTPVDPLMIAPTLSKFLQTGTITSSSSLTSSIPNVPELSSINSFAQLKYACEHDGKFFILDLITGAVSRINVCIKNNSKSNNLPPKMVNNPCYKVIDLTTDEEQLKELTKPADKESLPERSLLKDSYNLGSVKPLKLFKSGKSKKRSHVTDLDSNPSSSHQPRQGKTEQHIKNYEYMSNLEKSSAGEYKLRDNEAVSECDSSDDEPLAFKAKRIRSDDHMNITNRESNANLEVGEFPGPGLVADCDVSTPENTITFICDSENSQDDSILGF